MGFRDLSKFNIALLAKQGWRLLENPGLLTTQLTCAKYCNGSNFLEASLSANPSLLWRSIWGAKGFLKSGLRWRIRSGSSVSIWQDYWLPGKNRILITTNRVAGMECVSDLILHNPNRWNRELIYSTFMEEEGNLIVSIPLPITNQSDNVHPRPRDLNKWVPPLPNWVKINVDTGFSAARQHAASGFIIRNDEWLIMGSGFKTHNLVRSVVLDEATVVLHGLQFAPEMGFSNVILESDSRPVIQNLQSSKEDYSEIRPLTWDAKALARNFSSCRFEFVARDWNSAAHAMAVEGLKRFEDFFWVEDAPVTALEMADSDQRFN
ncbi:hypothetical protein PVK06_047499 [Gossypium arboreum]|uniref:RNase H type-1 domain-containing protein n=1 Tax=Gossypium arboreum TaxID=29729 RepID=A0ABR0MDZ0_GOSAR|nr:hypothetical protein PVK06_047499 [Gossypium arboreum]